MNQLSWGLVPLKEINKKELLYIWTNVIHNIYFMYISHVSIKLLGRNYSARGRKIRRCSEQPSIVLKVKMQAEFWNIQEGFALKLKFKPWIQRSSMIQNVEKEIRNKIQSCRVLSITSSSLGEKKKEKMELLSFPKQDLSLFQV